MGFPDPYGYGVPMTSPKQMSGESGDPTSVTSYQRTLEHVPPDRHSPADTNENVYDANPGYLYGIKQISGTGTVTIRNDTGANGSSQVWPDITLGSDDGFFTYPLYLSKGLTLQFSNASDVAAILWRQEEA